MAECVTFMSIWKRMWLDLWFKEYMNEWSLGGGSEQMCLTFPGVEYFLTTVRTFQSIFQRAFKLFFFNVHNWSIFSQLYTLFKEFSALKIFSQNCARPSKKTFCSCFPFLTYERLILPGRNNSRLTFFFQRSKWRLIYCIIWLLPSGRWALGYGGAATVLQ